MKKGHETNYYISEVNRRVKADADEFVAEAERRFDGEIAALADAIANNLDSHRLVLLTGPSNAGKTTSSLKLCHELKPRGIAAHSISLDNFFMDRAKIPRDADGKLDYESPLCVDIPLFEDCMKQLMRGRRVRLPRYNFHTGFSEAGEELSIDENELIIVEGIHTLNPVVSGGLPQDRLFKIYLRIAAQFLSDDGEVALSYRRVRMIRRLIRDYRFRSADPKMTFDFWRGVLYGEEKYIKPFLGCADTVVDASFAYEPCVMRAFAVALLEQVKDDCTYGAYAKKIINVLSQFEPLPSMYVPSASLLREFIGGSDYYEDEANKQYNEKTERRQENVKNK